MLRTGGVQTDAGVLAYRTGRWARHRNSRLAFHPSSFQTQ
jgi:hypothetical protein